MMGDIWMLGCDGIEYFIYGYLKREIVIKGVRIYKNFIVNCRWYFNLVCLNRFVEGLWGKVDVRMWDGLWNREDRKDGVYYWFYKWYYGLCLNNSFFSI